MNREKSGFIFQTIVICGLFILFITGIDTVIVQSREGLRTVLVVLPSVYPMLVLSGLWMRSGALQRIAKRCGGGFERFFRLPRAAFPAFLLGIVSGFPVGAKCAAELYQSGAISREEAQRLAAFTNFCSPLFLVGGIGRSALGSARFGWLLFALQSLFAVVFGFLYARPKEYRPRSFPSLTSRPPSFFSALSGAVSSSAVQMLKIAGFILFFRMLSGVLWALLPDGLETSGAACLFFGFFELSSGSAALISSSAHAPIYAALLAGFSGLSVLMQCSSFLNEKELSPRGLISAHILCAPFLAAAVFGFEVLIG